MNSADEAFLPVPSSPAEVPEWFARVRARCAEGQCWRCGLTITEIESFDREDGHWTLHCTVDRGPITAQSCCKATADLFEALTDEYFDVMARYVRIQ